MPRWLSRSSRRKLVLALVAAASPRPGVAAGVADAGPPAAVRIVARGLPRRPAVGLAAGAGPPGRRRLLPRPALIRSLQRSSAGPRAVSGAARPGTGIHVSPKVRPA